MDNEARKRQRNNGDGTSDPAGGGEGSADAGGDYFSRGEGPAVLHFDGAVPQFLTPAMPSAVYRSRGTAVKSTIHWGQRKLLMSEMQLLTLFAERGESYFIVYVGAAPGSHLAFLNDLFAVCGHRWELIDPGAFDRRLVQQASKPSPSFTLRNEYFDNRAAYHLAARRLAMAKCPALASIYSLAVEQALLAATTAQAGLSCDFAEDVAAGGSSAKATDGSNPEHARTTEIPIRYEPIVDLPVGLSLLFRVASRRVKMLFISDVRSGREDHGNFEAHVEENTKAQETWAEIINPTFAMLKFRLPYTFTSRFSYELKRQVVVPSTGPAATLHCGGTVLLPIWTRPTSTETRLVVPEDAAKRLYSHKEYEDQIFFFNAVLREKVHFNHIAPLNEHLDHRFDSSAEVRVLERYLELYGAESNSSSSSNANESGDEARRNRLGRAIVQLSERITREVGGSFESAIRNREDIYVTKGQRGGWEDAVSKRLGDAKKIRSMPIWWRNAPAAGDVMDPRVYAWKMRELTPSQERPRT